MQRITFIANWKTSSIIILLQSRKVASIQVVLIYRKDYVNKIKEIIQNGIRKVIYEADTTFDDLKIFKTLKNINIMTN